MLGGELAGCVEEEEEEDEEDDEKEEEVMIPHLLLSLLARQTAAIAMARRCDGISRPVSARFISPGASTVRPRHVSVVCHNYQPASQGR